MKAQVAFSKSKGIISNLIKLWTIGSYSHVELVIDGMSYTAGVSENAIRCKYIDYKKESNIWDVYELDMTDEQIKVMLQFYKDTEGRKYDFKGIVLSQFLWFVNKDDKDRYFCSEWTLQAIDLACNRTLLYGGKPVSTKKYSKFSPNRLHKYLIDNGIISNDDLVKL
jgi:hypothetical protein